MKYGKFLPACIILPTFLCFCTGCQSRIVAPGQTAMERDVRISRVQKLHDQYLQDDIDAFFLIDKPSNLNYWHIR